MPTRGLKHRCSLYVSKLATDHIGEYKGETKTLQEILGLIESDIAKASSAPLESRVRELERQVRELQVAMTQLIDFGKVIVEDSTDENNA